MAKPHLIDAQKSTLLDKWCTTPLSMQDFCHQENISTSSFNRWRQQLTVPPEIQATEADWIELEPSKQDKLPVLPDPKPNWNIELVLPGDVILRYATDAAAKSGLTHLAVCQTRGHAQAV